MVGQGGDQDTGHDGPGFAETCGKHQCKQLRLVAHFGERDDSGGDEEGFQETNSSRDAGTSDYGNPPGIGGCAVKGLA